MKSSKQIKIGSIVSYIAIVINIVVGLVYTPWMLNKIGKSEYGLYTLANSLITLFLVDFGLSSATARYVSNYHAAKDEESVNNFLGIIYKFYVIVDIVIFLILFVLYFFIDRIYINLTSEELKKFKVVYLIAASFSLVNLPFVTLNGILTAYEKFIQLKLADLIYRVLVVGFSVLALLMGWGLYALVAVNAIAGIIVIVYKLFIIKCTTKIKVNFRAVDKQLEKSIFVFSFWTMVMSVAGRLIFSVTPSILGIVANSTAIAVFGVVVTIEGYTYTITTAINGMFMPTISRAYYESDDEARVKLMPLMINVGRFQFSLNGLIFIGFALVGKSFISLWVGADYAVAYYCILLVIFPGLFFNSLQVANTAMTVRNEVKLQAIVAVVCGVLNVALSFVLSKLYGVMGACISICFAYIVRAILYHIIHDKVMGFNIKQFIVQCYLRMIPTILITFGFGLLMNNFIVDGGWGRLLLKCMLIVVFYLLSVILLGLSKKERKFILEKTSSMFCKRKIKEYKNEN